MKPKNNKLDNVIQELKNLIDNSATNINILEKQVNELSEISATDKRNKKNDSYLFLLFIILISGLFVWFYMVFDRNDALESKVLNLESELKYYQRRDSLFVEIMGLDSASTIVYKSKGDRPITYQELSNISDSCSIQLKAITTRYPIKVNRSGNSYWAESAQIDSALLLLPVYRDMISYDPHKKIWSIVRYNP